MRRTALRWLAVVSLLALAASAEERPRYGGTLRVQLREPVYSLDPADGKDLTLARQRLAFLLFDRLTKIDDKGRVQPQLAVSWSPDTERRVWRFYLRGGVTFHDGTALASAHVVSLFANDPRWQVRAGNGTQVVVFECANPIADLPAVLAGARYSIVLRGAEGVQGTGPFKIAAWQPGRQLSLAANLDHFEGRPYLDAVEIVMGSTLREQLIDMRLGADDIVEVDLEQTRRLSAASQRVDAAAHNRLLALVFPSGAPATRELLRASLDRDSIHAAILRRSGAPAASLLPQWLTGYSLLFSGATDPARLQKLKTDAAKAKPLYLAYDPSEPALKAVAERIAVNARDVGLTVQVFAEKNPAANTRADVLLVTLPLGSANPTQALVQLAEAARLEQAELLAATGSEALYAAEQALLADSRLIPVAHLPAPAWLSTRVRNWKLAPDGRWKLEEVWVESNK